MAWLNVNRLAWDDLQLVRRYSDQPRQLCYNWCRAQFAPWFAQRFCIMSRYAPGWLPWETRQDIWLGLDRWGWMIYPHTIQDAAGQRRALEFARRQYAPALDHFRITPIADRALHELLALCRREGIAAMLVLMPEGTVFQSWYAPAARAEIDSYLASVSREFAFPLVDARSWLPDTAFFDSHHLHPDGATAFTERFARDVPGVSAGLGPEKAKVSSASLWRTSTIPDLLAAREVPRGLNQVMSEGSPLSGKAVRDVRTDALFRGLGNADPH
jgi:hypothetical protein